MPSRTLTPSAYWAAPAPSTACAARCASCKPPSPVRRSTLCWSAACCTPSRSTSSERWPRQPPAGWWSWRPTAPPRTGMVFQGRYSRRSQLAPICSRRSIRRCLGVRPAGLHAVTVRRRRLYQARRDRWRRDRRRWTPPARSTRSPRFPLMGPRPLRPPWRSLPEWWRRRSYWTPTGRMAAVWSTSTAPIRS